MHGIKKNWEMFFYLMTRNVRNKYNLSVTLSKDTFGRQNVLGFLILHPELVIKFKNVVDVFQGFTIY